MSNKKKKKKKKQQKKKRQVHSAWISIGSIKYYAKIPSKQCMPRSDVAECSCKIAVSEIKKEKEKYIPVVVNGHSCFVR